MFVFEKFGVPCFLETLVLRFALITDDIDHSKVILSNVDS